MKTHFFNTTGNQNPYSTANGWFAHDASPSSRHTGTSEPGCSQRAVLEVSSLASNMHETSGHRAGPSCDNVRPKAFVCTALTEILCLSQAQRD